MPSIPPAPLAAALLAALALAALAGAYVYLTFFRRYRVRKVFYGSPEVEREFRDVPGMSWPIPRRLLTAKQMSAAGNGMPAPPLRYETRSFPCEIWPELGDVVYDEVSLPAGQAPACGAPADPRKGVYLFVCPTASNSHIRCLRRAMYRLLHAGYRCCVLATRGNEVHPLDPARQKVYVDECWNLQDMFEMVRHLAARPGGLPPLHVGAYSLGAMRVAHFLAQVGKLVRKQADEARGAASPVRHDGDNALRHNWRGFDNAGTREVARLLQARLASCAILFPHYDCKQPIAAIATRPWSLAWAFRPMVRRNEAALRVYLAEALRESLLAGRDPASLEPGALDRLVAAEVDRTIRDVLTRLETLLEYDEALAAPLARQASVTDYYTSSVVSPEELREIAGLTRASGARVLYLGVADDTITTDVFPHDYAAQGIEGRVLAVQLDRGQHACTVLPDTLDVAGALALRVAEARLGGPAPEPGGAGLPAETAGPA